MKPQANGPTLMHNFVCLGILNKR